MENEMSRPIETPPGTQARPAANGNSETTSGATQEAVAGTPETPASAESAPATTAPASASQPPMTMAEADAAALAAKPGAPTGPVDRAKMEQLIIDALHTIYDPEIPVDIYELGLIYSVDVSEDGKVAITMTLTTPACPVAGSMPGQVEKTVRMVDGVTDVVVDLVWEPTWGPAMMTESARLQLNMY
jgi:FeS assembly SUF system protein